MTPYSDPKKYGVEIIGEVDWSHGGYEFDLTVVWRRLDGVFVYADDSGCSCPSPFDDYGVDTLEPFESLNAFQRHLETKQADHTDDYGNESGYRAPQIAELLERLHKAGAR